MKYLLDLGVAGLLMLGLPAMAAAQATPQNPPPQPIRQSTPQTQSSQNQPMQGQSRQGQSRQGQSTTRASSDAQREIATAHTHALMAQGAKSEQKARQHLHHVVNCLEGPSGNDFDRSAGDPCQGQGQGALPDSQGHATRQQHVQQALAKARKGLQASSLSDLHRDAAKVASLLQPSSGGANSMSSGM